MPIKADDRKAASAKQIEEFFLEQAEEWRVDVVKSIRRIVLNIAKFYEEDDQQAKEQLTPQEKENQLIRRRNGWFFEAISQAIQAIEDLFATTMKCSDVDFFVKDVLYYNSNKLKEYIWNFDYDHYEYICKQFGVPYSPIDEPWDEAKDVFDKYREGLLLIREYIKEIVSFHKKYYDDYCRYKHGLSVKLLPFPNSRYENIETILSSHENGLYSFHNNTISDYANRNKRVPAIMLSYEPNVLKNASELHAEGNLLFSTLNVVDIDNIVVVVEHSHALYCALRKTIINRIRLKKTDPFFEVFFPTKDAGTLYSIGYPNAQEAGVLEDGN